MRITIVRKSSATQKTGSASWPSPRRARFKRYLGGTAMFGDTDLPLALIMEEILGWEKKPGEKDEEEKENTQLSSTSKKSWTQKEKSERRFYIFLRLLDSTIHLCQISAALIWNKGELSYLFFLSRPYQAPVRLWPVSPWRCCLLRFGPGRLPDRGAAWDSHRTFGGGSVRPASSLLPSCNSLKQLERNRSVRQGRFQSSGYGWPCLGARNPTKFEVILWTLLCSSFIDIFESVLSSAEAETRRTPWGLYLSLLPPRGVPGFRWNYTEST